MDEANPVATRPYAPGYGIPADTEGTLSWEHVLRRLAEARHYWVDTADRTGRVHATPIWGALVDGTLYGEGGPGTRRGRNIAENPQVVVHLESGEDVVIVEGIAEHVVPPDAALATRLVKALDQKYGAAGYHPTPGQWDEGGLYAIRPHKVFAWTSFPRDATRFTFAGQGE